MSLDCIAYICSNHDSAGSVHSRVVPVRDGAAGITCRTSGVRSWLPVLDDPAIEDKIALRILRRT